MIKVSKAHNQIAGVVIMLFQLKANRFQLFTFIAF